MKKLWATWRSDYIKKGCRVCPFCFALEDKKDLVNFLVFRGESSFVLLNKFPYNPGHFMVIPNRHVSEISDLEKTEREYLFELLHQSIIYMKEAFQPSGYNVGINAGKYAGAGISEHLHIHVVPRWVGDTNFMPTIVDTKIISLKLKEVFVALRRAFNEDF